MTIRPSRRNLSLGSATAVLAVLATPVAAYAQARTHSFDVPSQDLGAALRALARQSGEQVIFEGRVVRGKRSTAIAGIYSTDEAMGMLLRGTDLHASRSQRGILVVSAVPGSGEDEAGGAAADSGSADGTDASREILVTGTRIQGATVASPTQVITREDISNSGYSQVGDIVRSIPQNFNGAQNPNVISAVGNTNVTGGSTVNLRGLGPDATLVLVNGTRLSTQGTNAAPDISIIPASAIRRIEIVTDGASALYGSDAIAGVMNFILVDDFEGAEVSTRFGITTQGGGFEQTHSGLAGARWTGGNLLGGIEYSEQDWIRASQRDVTENAPASNTLIPAQERLSTFASLNHDLSPGIRLGADGLYMVRQTRWTTQSLQTAPRQSVEANVESYLLAARADVDLFGDWTGRASASYGHGQDDTVSRFSNGTTSPGATENGTAGVEASMSGTLLVLPTGPIQLAAGAGYRRETHRFVSPITIRNGARDIGYAFAELLLPLVPASGGRPGLHRLDLSAAIRAEHYSDAGGTTSPKLGIRYMPLATLTLRATWGESFKAPTFTQLLTAPITTLRRATQLGGAGTGAAMLLFGGNPDLRPERSTSWTAGADWDLGLFEGLRVSATYFDVDYTDRILTPISGSATALSNPVNEPFITRNPTVDQQDAVIAASEFSNLTGAPYNPANVVAIIDGRFVNATAQRVRGVDVSLRQSIGLPDGRLDLFANGSWLDLKQQNLPTLPLIQRSGRIFNAADFRSRFGATWRRGRLIATATVNHVSGALDNAVAVPVRVDSWTTVDFSLRLALPDWSGQVTGIEATLTVLNALDTEPPFAAGAGIITPGIGYDSTNTSAVGRQIALTLRQRF